MLNRAFAFTNLFNSEKKTVLQSVSKKDKFDIRILLIYREN